MKKVSIAAAFLTLVLALSGCLNDDGVNFYNEPIPITEITDLPDTLEPGETYTIDFTYKIPTDCHSYIGYQGFIDKEKSNDSVRVVTFAALAQVQTSKDSCRTLNSEKSSTIDDFKISDASPIPSKYTVQFWTGVDADGESEYIIYDIPVKKEEDETN
ncbi:hypothetical protein [Sinomicrobium weinanense]|uniref:Lipoprotein n=1 Tax=Sinomicrobium weinanense TaxID=2842200 RepID=A0A926Q061_9FLAO|nr:hypothetical protein [Sinomicrobium weinanense]MBC9794573.1 hypothetical protein [Sinomicrobium weinanense]MBU3124058.1 hypothetical protein [Sinomicrobium weinanense]